MNAFEKRVYALFTIIVVFAGGTWVYSQTPPGPNTIQHGEGANYPTVTAEDGYYYGNPAVNITDQLFGDFGVLPITGGDILGTSLTTAGAVMGGEYYLGATNVTEVLSVSQGATATVGFNANLDYLPNYWYCDGVADNVQLQAAMDYTESVGGGKILVEEGDYSISLPVNIYGSIWVCGEGMGSTRLTLANGANCNIFQWLGTGNQFWFKLSDIYLDGNRANNLVAGTGLYIDPTTGTFSDWRVRDVAFMYFKEYGIYSTDGWQAYIHGCIVEHCSIAGMYLFQGNIYIDECAFLFNQIGLYLTSGEYFSVQTCKFHQQSGNGLNLDATCDNSMVSDCNFVGNGQAAVNTYRGIFVDRYADNNKILGCTFNGASQEKEGIYIEANAVNTIIRDNYFYNHVTKAITDSSSTTKISQNIGYVTENIGSATILNGTTSIVINHGLGYTPTSGNTAWTVSYLELPTNDPGSWYIDTFTATQATIHVLRDPGVSHLDISWSARRTP